MATINSATLQIQNGPVNEWYVRYGWIVFNELLSELEHSICSIVWVENFDSVRNALLGISKKDLMSLFNEDSLNWAIRADKDGVLYAVKKT